jgi:glycosyltransferase involved in cell wall biosynthesis
MDKMQMMLLNTPDKKFTLSLVIPCYNEEQTIAACLEIVRSIVAGQDFALEIIIVNDASTDGSLQELQVIAKKYPEIKLLNHIKNQGKGAALRTGFIQAAGDFVGIQDADDEYDPADYLKLLRPLLGGRADVVYGSRYLRPETRRVHNFWHTTMNRFLTKLSNFFTNLDLTDMETCYKLFRRDVIREIAPKLRENRFGFEPEITARVAQGHYCIYECAVSYNPRSYGSGKKIGWQDGVRALTCIMRYNIKSVPFILRWVFYLLIFSLMALEFIGNCRQWIKFLRR